MPLAQNIEPFLTAPFTGDYSTSNVFDHNYPFPFENTGGDQLTWWGETIVMGYDGHAGYDWRMPEGTRLLAAAKGEVVQAGPNRYFCSNPSVNRNVEGINVILRHTVGANTLYTSYAHMSEVFVQEGDSVEGGFTIGRSGNTGCSTTPHLHFSVKIEQEDGSLIEIDPYGWHGSIADPWASHAEGAKSHDLWLTAPLIFRESVLQEDFSGEQSVWIKRVRYMGIDDNTNPNNEFIELKLNTDVAPNGYYLGGHRFKNNAGDIFYMPENTYIYPKKNLRIYSGQGENTERSIYLGSDKGIWHDNEDCVQLQRSTGSALFRFWYNTESCIN